MSCLIRISQTANGLFMATAHLDRIATSPELAARIAGAAVLGCDDHEVHVSGQARDLFLVSKAVKPISTPMDCSSVTLVDALSRNALHRQLCDVCHGKEVRP